MQIVSHRCDFYILKSLNQTQLILKFAKKCLNEQHSLLIYSDLEDTLTTLDTALWTMEPESFIPHQLVKANESARAPILLSTHCSPSFLFTHLLCLSPTLPAEHERASRLFFIVEKSAGARAESRILYKACQERGYELHNHEV